MDFCDITNDVPPTPISVVVGNPGAGAEWTADPSPNAPFSLIGVGYSLTTSATVANRVAGMTVAGLNTLQGSTQTAGLGPLTYSFFPGAQPSNNSGPVPLGPFPAGSLVSSFVLNLQAADTITAVVLMIQPEQPPAIPV